MLIDRGIDETVQRIPDLDNTSLKISRAIHKGVLQGGPATRAVADVLHGIYLGHPLHPILTDITVGGWVLGAVFDLLWLMRHERRNARIADTLLGIGTAAAVPTALSGLADFTTIPARAAGTGLLHAALNVTNLALFGASLALRKHGNRHAGAILSVIALGTAGLAAMLGGHLTFSQRVGVDHDEPVGALPQWMPVLALDQLPARAPRRLDVHHHPVLLYRDDGEVYAVSAVCSHDGGPLQQGKFNDCCVECPLHQSVFNLRDGSVVHGPSTYPLTSYQTRVRDGQIELRLERERK